MAADTSSSLAHRRALVETLRADGRLYSPRAEAALLAVPREVFVPALSLDEVYSPTEAIVTKRMDGVSVSSASAPEVVALMLEQLDPREGDHVLEIGAGTGYNAALLAHMVGERGRVVSIDLDEDLVTSAREHLAAVGYDRVEVIQGDGALGHPTTRPYDRIILTVASGDIAPAWREQLASPPGRLVMPLALRSLQRCIAFDRDEADPDCLVGGSMRNCSFISLRGLLGSPPIRVPIDRDGKWVLSGEDDRPPFESNRIEVLLRGPVRTFPVGVRTTVEEVRQGLHLWLVAHDRGVYTLWTSSRMPDLFGLGERAGARGTLCLVDAAHGALALLTWSSEGTREGELFVVSAPRTEGVGRRLQRLVLDWAYAGRPSDAEAELRAYPAGKPSRRAPGEVAIDTRWSHFELKWRPRIYFF